MIVLWGIPSEPPMRLAIEAAERAGIDHVVVNQRRAATYDLMIDPSDPGDGWLVVDGRELRLGDVDGVYVRIMEPARLPEQASHVDPDLVARSAAFHAMLLAWVEFAPCRVANRAAAMASNGSKPYQAQLILDAGFDTPPTLVTDDPSEVARFEARHGRLIYKSTSSVRSIVRALDEPARGRLDQLRWLPTQFQRFEAGTDVRVHVVGDAVFAARATSTAIDYRYATSDGVDVELTAMELPDDVARRCVALATALELPFSGIDLRERPDGSWVCFEVNPSPGYSWYETAAGLPISDRLVMWLDGSIGSSGTPSSVPPQREERPMVQIVENWAELTGTVRSIADSDKGPGHRTLLVEAGGVADVDGFPNLVGANVGDVVPIIVRHDELDRAGVCEGSHVHVRVRKATPFEIFAGPDGLLVGDPEAETDRPHDD